MEKQTPVEKDEVIVVADRPGRGSAKLLPPILIVMLGLGFLAYRSRSSDWRGVSALFERRTTPVAPPEKGTLVARADPAPPVPTPTPAPEKAKEGSDKNAAKEPPQTPPKDEALEDIRREAEKTKERIAELEAFKEREAKKLEETAEERARDELQARRQNRRFGMAIPPAQIEAMIRAQQEQLARLMDEMQRGAMGNMDAFQRRQAERFSEMERRFFNGRMGQPFAAPMPMPMPGFGPLLGPDRGRMEKGAERLWRDPQGGVARLREFRGPGGMRGFELHWRGGPAEAQNGDQGNDVPPPPPRPDRLGGRILD